MPATASPTPEPVTAPEPKREATLAETRAMAHPLRLRIIRLLFDRSLTNRELARALGEHPATVLHHVRTLLRTGFIAAEPERRGPRGTIEKPYRSTGRSWTLSVEDDEEGAASVSQAVVDAFLAEVRDAGPVADLRTTRLPVNLTSAARDDLERKFSELLAEYAAIPPDADGEPWAVLVATHRRAPLATDADATPPSAMPSATTARRQMPPEVQIIDRAPDDEMAIFLVRAQWAELTARYGVPEAEPASISNPGAFRAPTGAFVGLSVDDVAVGCGGVCEYGGAERIGELKAIYVSPMHRGNGYGRLIVQALEVRAQHIGYRVLRLETGDAQPEAIALYRSLGYSQIERYGPYRDLVRSVCFERTLEP